LIYNVKATEYEDEYRDELEYYQESVVLIDPIEKGNQSRIQRKTINLIVASTRFMATIIRLILIGFIKQRI